MAGKFRSTFGATGCSRRKRAHCRLKRNCFIGSRRRLRRIFNFKLQSPMNLQIRNLKARLVLGVLWALFASICKQAQGVNAMIKCVEPDEGKGMSEAVIVEDEPLVHTMQVIGPEAEA